jgi:hypothetical protein
MMMKCRRERSGMSRFVCHDPSNTGWRLLAHPPISHSLQPSFFFFFPRRRNAAQPRFPQTVNLPLQKSDFRLRRHASELERRLQDNGPMPASDRQSGFHHSFLEAIFCFSPGPACFCGFDRHVCPCHTCGFRVLHPSLLLAFICGSQLSYPPPFYPSLALFLNVLSSIVKLVEVELPCHWQLQLSSSLGAPAVWPSTNPTVMYSLRDLLFLTYLFLFIFYEPHSEDGISLELDHRVH